MTMTTIKPQDQIQSCSYWSLSQEERDAVNASAPDLDQWEFEVYRLPDGNWAFDRPDLKTERELLIGNTEKVLDIYYNGLSECPPDEYSRMAMTVSRVLIKGATTAATYIRADSFDSNSSIYRDDQLLMEYWLCPWLTQCMGWSPAPKRMWINLEVLS